MTKEAATLERVRKLLAKAEAEGVTPAEAEALTGKATELMARYGIDRVLLAATEPQTDKPGDKIVVIDNPWASVKASLLGGLTSAMRCSAVQLSARAGARVHVFGFQSDLERVEILYTSLLLQMAHGLIRAEMPVGVRSIRAWRRSWLLGFAIAVTQRVQAAEARATSDSPGTTDGKSTALVLADRSLVIQRKFKETYPVTRKQKITYTGRGYSDGYSEGQRAQLHNQASAGTANRTAVGS